MPDPTTAVLDTPVATPPAGPGSARGGAPGTGPDTAKPGQELILGKYESMETATVGHAELEKKFGDQSRELGEMRRQMETLQTQAQLAARLDQIAANTAPKEEPPDFDAWISREAERHGWDDEEKERLRFTAQMQSAWVTQESDRLRAENKQARDAVTAELKELRDAQVKLSPEYQANKDLIERFTAKGMAPKDAIEMAAELRANAAPTVPPRDTPPAGAGGGRATVHGSESAVYLTPEDRAQMKADEGLTDEELDSLEADYQARAAARRAEVEEGL